MVERAGKRALVNEVLIERDIAIQEQIRLLLQHLKQYWLAMDQSKVENQGFQLSLDLEQREAAEVCLKSLL